MDWGIVSMRCKSKLRTILFTCLALSGLVVQTGCHRSEDAYDDRTLEKRPHTETVKPDDRRDVFRP